MLDLATGTIRHPIRTNSDPIIEVRRLNLWYGKKQALQDIHLDVPQQGIIAFIGPSGCGKSTLLKCLNRMHDDIRGIRITGSIHLQGQDIMAREVDPPLLRRRFGWVAQRPNPFVCSIWRNVAYPAGLHAVVPDEELADHVETCLRRAQLWDDVADRLNDPAQSLSIGQQQRLCIARALSTKPDVLLMDEPTGSLDPISTEKIERLVAELGQDHPVIIITHSMMQARRLSDVTAYFHLGELVEIGPTLEVFNNPIDPRTDAFIRGDFG